MSERVAQWNDECALVAAASRESSRLRLLPFGLLLWPWYIEA